MRLVILAAGEGTRLRPYTTDKPKCMVPFNGKPIISHILDTIQPEIVKEICIVLGYQSDTLEDFVRKNHRNHDITYRHNEKYDETNMVYTLFCAEDFLKGDIIISYSDIIYNKTVLKKLMDAEGDICVVVDRDWKQLWDKRMEDPLEDAETMKFDDQGYIMELGKKPKSIEDIQGQYIGLIKISSRVIDEVKDFYHDMDKNSIYDGKDYDNMFMTSFIQNLIHNGFKIKPVMINGGWVEIDTVEDLENLKNYSLEDGGIP